MQKGFSQVTVPINQGGIQLCEEHLKRGQAVGHTQRLAKTRILSFLSCYILYSNERMLRPQNWLPTPPMGCLGKEGHE